MKERYLEDGRRSYPAPLTMISVAGGGESSRAGRAGGRLTREQEKRSASRGKAELVRR